jgi:CheY-like chemotaxis protein
LENSSLVIYLIEDNRIDSLVADGVIKKTLLSANVKLFSEPCAPLKELQESMSHIKELAPQLIFLDIAMPGMDGFDFLAHYMRLQLDSLATPPLIYLLTTSLSPRDLVKARSHPHVEEVLFKPFTQNAFSSILERHFPWLTYNKVIEKRVAQSKELTIDNWFSEYKRLERTYTLLKDKQSLEAQGLLDHMEAVFSIIMDINNQKKK